MNTDPETIECRLQNDRRLIAGASAIVSHVANRAGILGDAQANFAKAFVQVCEAAFRKFDFNGIAISGILLTADSRPTEVQLTIDFAEKAPDEAALVAKGQKARLSAKALDLSGNGGLVISGIDRMSCEARDNGYRVTLVKQRGNVPCTASTSRD